MNHHAAITSSGYIRPFLRASAFQAEGLWHPIRQASDCRPKPGVIELQPLQAVFTRRLYLRESCIYTNISLGVLEILICHIFTRADISGIYIESH